MDFDIAVVGLGAMGSATVRALAKAGARVAGFDRLHPPHTLGSTHGHSRIIREAYYEHPLYVPLVRRAYELWEELERESGEQLLQVTGGLMVGPASGSLIRGAEDSARAHGIAHDMLDPAGIVHRFPAFASTPQWVGLFEHRAGMLFPERCVEAMLRGGAAAGAALKFGERVLGWREDGRAVRIQTTHGNYTAGCVVVSAGPWLPELEQSVGRPLPLVIERQLSHWFLPKSPEHPKWKPGSTPIALWQANGDDEIFATFPLHGPGVKCGMHHAGSHTSPDSVDRAVSAREDQKAALLLGIVMPGAAASHVESRVCLYTNTPDRHFLIDWATPGRVLLVSPCSGHGFKFATAVGEVAAQLALEGRAWIDLAPFSLSRFA